MSLPKTYKAVVCNKANDPWQVVERQTREPGPDEILIRVYASGICNSDHWVKDGGWPGLTYPRVAGHEVIGRIAKLGSNVDPNGRFKLNGLVGVGWNGGYCKLCKYCREGEYWTCEKAGYTGYTFDGGHAEFCYAPESSVLTLPEDILQRSSYAELAPLFCAGTTVYDAIRTTKWQQGDTCLIQGIGGLGHLAIQYASKMGLKVYAVSSGSSKRDLALSLGASEYIDSSSTNVVEYFQKLGGAKVILCTAPYAKHISSILPALGKNGTITLVSAATDAPIQVENLLLNLNRGTLRGWCCGDALDMEKCVRFSDLANIKTMVQTYTLEEFANAYDGVMQNKAKFRNVIVFDAAKAKA
ncbi:hypothetical protein AX16_007592 [Volvariella volvacea WC 439]|nr:hypothetical protein AX16_007592 [Volvariella volvacea WC 439]